MLRKKIERNNEADKSEFWFSEPENTACVTCCHVMHGHAEIVNVFHDEDDGGWQFLCGEEHETKEFMLVSLKQVVEVDPSVNGLHEMPLGCGATRESKWAAWKGFKQ